MIAVARAEVVETVKLGTANTVTLRGEITEQSAQTAALELIALDAARLGHRYPIYLVLDTPGGSIDAGENLIEVVKSIPDVRTITLFAASMGSSIVEALPGDRLITESGQLMFHRAKGQVGGQFETGELESRLDFYKKYVRRMEQRSADRMGLSLKTYKRKVKDELWLTAEDSLKSNAADRIVAVTCTRDLINRNQHLTAEVFIFKVNLDYSGCPILRTPSVSSEQGAEAVAAYQKYSAVEEFKRNLSIGGN